MLVIPTFVVSAVFKKVQPRQETTFFRTVEYHWNKEVFLAGFQSVDRYSKLLENTQEDLSI